MPRWIATIDLKEAWAGQEESTPGETAKLVVEAIDALKDPPDPETLKVIRDKFQRMNKRTSPDHFNAVLDKLYDYGDANRVWIATTF